MVRNIAIMNKNKQTIVDEKLNDARIHVLILKTFPHVPEFDQNT